MRIAWVALVLGLGCGKGGNDLDGRITELAKIRDEVCACKDKACADAAHDKYVKLKGENSKDDKPTAEQMDRYDKARGELQECWHTQNGTADPTK